MLKYRPGDPWARVVVIPCGKRACPACGPRVRERRADDLAELVELVALWRITLAAATWRNAGQNLRRAKVRYIAVPTSATTRVVFLDAPWPGAVPVADTRAELAAACAQLPAGARVRPSAGWPSTPQREPTDWRWWALRSGVEPLFRLAELADLKPRRGPDGFSLTMPEPGTREYRTLARERLPGGRPRRRRPAA